MQDIDRALIRELSSVGSCQVEEMAERLTGFTWNQMCAAIDRLSRKGTLALHRPARFDVEISIASGQPQARAIQASR
jgi:hypothetical protein